MNWLSQRFFRRRLLRSALLICLLALLSTILVLGVSQYLLSQEQFRLLDETNYTTVKLDDSHFYETTTVRSSTNNMTMADWSKLTYIPGLEEEMKSFHEASEEVLLYDHRQGLTMLCDTLHRAPEHSDMSLERVMSVPEIDTSKMTIDEIIAHEEMLYEQHTPLLFKSPVQGLITAHCLKIINYTVQREVLEVEQQTFIPTEPFIYTCYFEIDHSQSNLSAVCDDIRYMKITCFSLDENFRPFFQEGHDYKVAASGYTAFNVPLNEYFLEFVEEPIEALGILAIDSEIQYYLECSLFGITSYDLRVDLQELNPRERFQSYREDIINKKIPKTAYTDLAWDFDEDTVYTTDLYDSKVLPVWDLTEELTEAERAYKEDLFAQYDKYISLSSCTFDAILCRDPLLFPEFNVGNLYLEDKDATLELLESCEGSACVIPTQLADFYNIKVGDKIVAAVANSGYAIRDYDGDKMKVSGEIYEPYGIEVKLPSSLQELDYFNQLERQEFTVVGSFNYKSKRELELGTYLGLEEISNGDKYFRNGSVVDTIFIIDREEGFAELPFLMPDTANYQDFVSNKSNMLSVRLKNGDAHVEKYLSDMKEAGLEEYVLKIDDHGYSAIEPVLMEMKRENMSQLIIFGVSAITLLAFYFFMLRRFFRSDLERMYLLGTEQRLIQSSFFSVLLRYCLGAMILTAVISAVLLPTMEKNLQQKLQEIYHLEQSVLFNKLPSLIIVFAAIAFILLLLSYLYSRRMAKAAQRG